MRELNAPADTILLEPEERYVTASEYRYLSLALRAASSGMKINFHRLIRLPVILIIVGVMCWISIAMSQGIDGFLYAFWGVFGIALIAWIVRDMMQETSAIRDKFRSALQVGRVQLFRVDAKSVLRCQREGDLSDILLFALPDDTSLVLLADDFNSKKFPCLKFTIRHFLDEDGEIAWHQIRFRSAKLESVEQVDLRFDPEQLSSMQVLPGPPSSYVVT